jgi:hypothetical protein
MEENRVSVTEFDLGLRLVKEGVVDGGAAVSDLIAGSVVELDEEGERGDETEELDVAALTRRRYPGPGAWKV